MTTKARSGKISRVVKIEIQPESRSPVLELTSPENLGKIGKARRIRDGKFLVKLKNFLLTQENKTGKLGKLEGYAAVQRA